MTSPKTRAQLLATVAARMRYTPDLFDEACKMAADNIHKLDDATLALLVRRERCTPEQIDLLVKIFPLERAGPDSDDPTKA